VAIDFGRVLASGPTQQVLADKQVLRAYLGEDAA
jgi:ABC-type branched-subunit amino acid transport system ATPase component